MRLSDVLTFTVFWLNVQAYVSILLGFVLFLFPEIIGFLIDYSSHCRPFVRALAATFFIVVLLTWNTEAYHPKRSDPETAFSDKLARVGSLVLLFVVWHGLFVLFALVYVVEELLLFNHVAWPWWIIFAVLICLEISWIILEVLLRRHVRLYYTQTAR